MPDPLVPRTPMRRGIEGTAKISRGPIARRRVNIDPQNP
jgi:hypothetical protein